jgi:hypothetical protein
LRGGGVAIEVGAVTSAAGDGRGGVGAFNRAGADDVVAHAHAAVVAAANVGLERIGVHPAEGVSRREGVAGVSRQFPRLCTCEALSAFE